MHMIKIIKLATPSKLYEQEIYLADIPCYVDKEHIIDI